MFQKEVSQLGNHRTGAKQNGLVGDGSNKEGNRKAGPWQNAQIGQSGPVGPIGKPSSSGTIKEQTEIYPLEEVFQIPPVVFHVLLWGGHVLLWG